MPSGSFSVPVSVLLSTNFPIKLASPTPKMVSMQFIYEGIKKNNFSLGTAGLMQAAAELRQKGATKFILGCTELSVAASIYPFSNDFVDPLLILARRAIQEAGGKVIP